MPAFRTKKIAGLGVNNLSFIFLGITFPAGYLVFGFLSSFHISSLSSIQILL